MSNLPAVHAELPASQEQREVSRYDNAEIIATIKQTVAKGASDAQLRMFLEVCKCTGLDPFLKEIWYVAEKGIIMAGRDGYLRVANENPMFDGIETRVERNESTNTPIKAVCTVWRKDRTHPTICEAYFNEYKGSGPVWSKYPSAMIAKVAEVLALKRSFSINGVVSEEEMGADDKRGTREAAQAVAQAKIANGGTLPEPIEAEFVEPEPDPDPEMRLHLDILANTGKGKTAFNKFAMLQEIGKLKKRLQAVDQEPAYYRALNRCGVEKSNQFTDDENGKMARVAYKQLCIITENFEAKALETQLNASLDDVAPEVERLPDAVPLVVGEKRRYQNALWRVADSDAGHVWELVSQV
jgi:phage recombination protein Bet